MPSFKTITIKASAYQQLARHKQPGESFSTLIEHEFGDRIETSADLLAYARRRMAEGKPLFSGLKKKPARRAA